MIPRRRFADVNISISCYRRNAVLFLFYMFITQFCNVLFEIIILKIFLNERSISWVFYLILETMLWVQYAAKYYVMAVWIRSHERERALVRSSIFFLKKKMLLFFFNLYGECLVLNQILYVLFIKNISLCDISTVIGKAML